MEKNKLIKQMDKYVNNKMQITKLKELIARNMKMCSEEENLSTAMQQMYNLNIKYAKLISVLELQNKSIIYLIQNDVL